MRNTFANMFMVMYSKVPELQECWMHTKYYSQHKFVIIAKCFSSTNCHQALLYKNVRKHKYVCSMHWWLVRSHKFTLIY